MVSPTSKTEARRALIRLMHGRTAVSNARSNRRGDEIRRVLIVRPDHLGDLLFATPALDLIREAFPGAHITGLAGPWGRAMWEGNPNLDSLKVIPFPGIAGKKQGGPLAPYRLLGKAAAELGDGGYDLGVVLRFDYWWGAALLWAAGVPMRWGYDTPGMRVWLTDAVPYTPGRHEVEQNLCLAEAVAYVGVHGRAPFYTDHIAASTGAHSRAPLRADRGKGQPPLCPPRPVPPAEGLLGGWPDAPRRAVIHAGTAAANKLWTIRGWAEIADWLAGEGWSVALTGSPTERPLTEAIASASSSKPLNLAGRTGDIGQLVWVLDMARIVLGVDSGPLHIAAALHKPTLHLYGPSDERIWGPWGDPRKHRALRAPGTRPTMRLEVGSPELEGGPEMRAITPEMVMREVDLG